MMGTCSHKNIEVTEIAVSGIRWTLQSKKVVSSEKTRQHLTGKYLAECLDCKKSGYFTKLNAPIWALIAIERVQTHGQEDLAQAQQLKEESRV